MTEILLPDADGVQHQHAIAEVISREAAESAGYKRYFTGVPCMRGHLSERHVTNTRCVQCHREQAVIHRASSPTRVKKEHDAIVAANHAGKTIITRDVALETGLKRFFTGRPCSKGHISERRVSDHGCVECGRVKASKERQENPDRVRRRVRDSYRRDIEKSRARARDGMRKHHKENPARLRDRLRARRKSDPLFAFIGRSRAMVRSALHRSGFRKAKKTEEMLGCSLTEFRIHIERQFLPGMGWHNTGSWEIDHIVPMASAQTQEEAEALNKYSNLRPLWKADNRSKHKKQTHLL